MEHSFLGHQVAAASFVEQGLVAGAESAINLYRLDLLMSSEGLTSCVVYDVGVAPRLLHQATSAVLD